MQKFLRIALAFTLVFFGVFNLVAQQATKKGDEKAIKAQKKDLEILKKTILENTGNPFLYTDSLSLIAKFNEAEKKLNTPLSDLELYQLFSSLVMEVKCGHTQIMPSKRLIRIFYSYPTSLPGDVTLIDKKLYSLGTIRSKPRISKSSEILSINGDSISVILDNMHKHFASDGDNVTLKNLMFKDFFLMHYFFTYGFTRDYELSFVTKSKDTLSVTVDPDRPPLRSLERKLRTNPIVQKPVKGEYGKLKINKRDDYAKLTFETFYYADGKSYYNFLEESFEKIKKSGVGNLVIDVRNNLGGKPQVPLMGYLSNTAVPVITLECKDTKKPEYKKYFKKTREYRRYKKYIRKTKKAVAKGEEKFAVLGISPVEFTENNFLGNIYVLVNGFTFSAASNLAANLKDKCGATIIGEETGGSYRDGNTGQLILVLPYSKLEVIINPIYYNNMTSLEAGTAGLQPDVYVVDKFGQKRRDDPQLDEVEKLIKAKASN